MPVVSGRRTCQLDGRGPHPAVAPRDSSSSGSSANAARPSVDGGGAAGSSSGGGGGSASPHHGAPRVSGLASPHSGPQPRRRNSLSRAASASNARLGTLARALERGNASNGTGSTSGSAGLSELLLDGEPRSSAGTVRTTGGTCGFASGGVAGVNALLHPCPPSGDGHLTSFNSASIYNSWNSMALHNVQSMYASNSGNAAASSQLDAAHSQVLQLLNTLLQGGEVGPEQLVSAYNAISGFHQSVQPRTLRERLVSEYGIKSDSEVNQALVNLLEQRAPAASWAAKATPEERMLGDSAGLLLRRISEGEDGWQDPDAPSDELALLGLITSKAASFTSKMTQLTGSLAGSSTTTNSQPLWTLERSLQAEADVQRYRRASAPTRHVPFVRDVAVVPLKANATSGVQLVRNDGRQCTPRSSTGTTSRKQSGLTDPLEAASSAEENEDGSDHRSVSQLLPVRLVDGTLTAPAYVAPSSKTKLVMPLLKLAANIFYRDNDDGEFTLHDELTAEGANEPVLLRGPPDLLAQVLAKTSNWQFDTFELDELTCGHSLSVLSYALIRRMPAFEVLRMNERRLARYLLSVECGYRRDLYHCGTHAADVLRTLHVVCTRGGVWEGLDLPDSARFAMLLAAVVHDYEHKQKTNDFLIKTKDMLAIRYNDRMPMENHHVASAWNLLLQDSCNFLADAAPDAVDVVRKIVINLVLATEMKQHFALVGAFQAKLEAVESLLHASGNNTLSSQHRSGHHSQRGLSTRPSHQLSSGTSAASVASDASESSLTGMSAAALTMRMTAAGMVWDEDSTLLSMQIALKCADVGHLASELRVHKRWLALLEEEMFQQGDVEASAGLPVSPLMNRKGDGVMKSQVGFLSVVVLPMYKSLVAAFPHCSDMLLALGDNLAYWQEQERARQAADGA
uniref:PDEase domain-containing protein n=1 Tax=Chlamydomonas euryale TaxID=1486919 RepID=A0A7R9VPE0_9CHLO|mmetsp:Transcript_41391/g.123588  ORF Transcript_41391/g.123588 Transcript_41391/m.123588 type:complete len:910 (+) Transcript_41391:1725-4454(+)